MDCTNIDCLYEDWIYSDCVNNEDKVFELLKFDHGQYISDATLDIPDKACEGKKFPCKLQNNYDLSLETNIGRSLGHTKLNCIEDRNYKKLQTVLNNSARNKTLETIFCKSNHNVKSYNVNPFKSLRANILRLQGYVGRKQPLSKLKPLLHFLNSSTAAKDPIISESIRPLLEKIAAEIIQDFWNRCVFRAVFEHLRYHLHRCSGAEPALVLRPINPTEAVLLDAASGAYLRFRLGGAAFPPIILYKIFTNRPVIGVHLGSDASIKKRLNNKIIDLERSKSPIRGKKNSRSNLKGKDKEYNEWRPFMDPFLHVIQTSEISYGQVKKRTSSPKPPKSKEEQMRRRKREKIEWMQRLYRTGKQEETVHDSASESSVTSAEEQMTTRNNRDTFSEGDKATFFKHLTDFDSYQKTWSFTATTEVARKDYISPQLPFNKVFEFNTSKIF